MVSVTFILADGERVNLCGREGDTLMDVALDHGVPGIIAQCGGGCTCCTCHGYVAAAWRPHLPTPHPDEADMLEYAWQPQAGSRLLCQIPLTEKLEGVEVTVPARQFD
ncbi:MAG: 2Fe-2S iron-sulfur cluster-binding protein [Pseudomonadota bacterium]